MKAVGREWLDRNMCTNKECREKHTGIELHPLCHTRAGLDVEYADGVLKTACHECKQPVGAIIVGREDGAATRTA